MDKELTNPTLKVIITGGSFKVIPADKSLMFIWIYSTDIINVFWMEIIILQLRKPHFIHETGMFTEEEWREWLKQKQ